MKKMVICLLGFLLVTLLAACGERAAPESTTEQTSSAVLPTEQTSGEISTAEQTSEEASTEEQTYGVVPTTEGRIKTIKQPGRWGVSIEEVDLSLPKNKKYVRIAKGDWSAVGGRPEPCGGQMYFYVGKYDAQGYVPGDWVTVGKYEGRGSVVERRRQWTKTLELVIRDTHDNDVVGYKEFFVRDKTTGKIMMVDEGIFADICGVVFDNVRVISDTQFLYAEWYTDCYGEADFLYDLKVGDSICVNSNELLCDLGDGRYLWREYRYGEKINRLFIADANKFNAGDKDAKRVLVDWGEEYNGVIDHLSSDKRFVYTYLFSEYSGARYRAVYDVNTGECVAFFGLPEGGGGENSRVLMSDGLEYVFNAFHGHKVYADGRTEWYEPQVYSFFIIRYNQPK